MIALLRIIGVCLLNRSTTSGAAIHGAVERDAHLQRTKGRLLAITVDTAQCASAESPVRRDMEFQPVATLGRSSPMRAIELSPGLPRASVQGLLEKVDRHGNAGVGLRCGIRKSGRASVLLTQHGRTSSRRDAGVFSSRACRGLGSL